MGNQTFLLFIMFLAHLIANQVIRFLLVIWKLLLYIDLSPDTIGNLCWSSVRLLIFVWFSV